MYEAGPAHARLLHAIAPCNGRQFFRFVAYWLRSDVLSPRHGDKTKSGLVATQYTFRQIFVGEKNNIPPPGGGG